MRIFIGDLLGNSKLSQLFGLDLRTRAEARLIVVAPVKAEAEAAVKAAGIGVGMSLRSIAGLSPLHEMAVIDAGIVSKADPGVYFWNRERFEAPIYRADAGRFVQVGRFDQKTQPYRPIAVPVKADPR